MVGRMSSSQPQWFPSLESKPLPTPRAASWQRRHTRPRHFTSPPPSRGATVRSEAPKESPLGPRISPSSAGKMRSSNSPPGHTTWNLRASGSGAAGGSGDVVPRGSEPDRTKVKGHIMARLCSRTHRRGGLMVFLDTPGTISRNPWCGGCWLRAFRPRNMLHDGSLG